MNLAKKMLGCMSVIIISSVLIFPSFAKGVAEWKKNDKGWWYEEADGSYPTSAWKYITISGIILIISVTWWKTAG